MDVWVPERGGGERGNLIGRICGYQVMLLGSFFSSNEGIIFLSIVCRNQFKRKMGEKLNLKQMSETLNFFSKRFILPESEKEVSVNPSRVLLGSRNLNKPIQSVPKVAA